MNKSTVAKSELKNIKRFTRPALADINNVEEITGKTMEVLVPEVADALKMYGCRNQAMVVEVVSALAPVASEFFANFTKLVEATEHNSVESLDILLGFLNKEIDMSHEMKLQFYHEFNEADENRRNMIIRILLILVVGGGSAFLCYQIIKRHYAAKCASTAAIAGLGAKLLKAKDIEKVLAILKAL